MTAVAFAWIASLTYGFYSLTAKLIGHYRLPNVYQFSFFSLLFNAVVISSIALYNGAAIPQAWDFIIVAGITMALGSVLYLTALKNLDLSVIGPLFNIRTVITIILGMVFLGETFSPSQGWIAMIIIATGFFATMDEKFSLKSFFSPSVAIGLLFMLVLSVQTIFINRAVDQSEYWSAVMWMSLIAAATSLIVLFPKFKESLKTTPLKSYLPVALLAILGGVGDLAAYKAFSENVGISSIIISLPLSMIMAFALSFWKPNLLEKHPLKVYLVRFTAAAIMIWGSLQLSK